VVLNWATIASGATVSVNYFVAVTPAGAGAVNVTATPASGNGTRATYTPAFSSVTFPRTEAMGAICQITVQASTSVPNAVALSKFEAHGYAGAVWLEWDTASEWANLGFNVYRAEGSTGRFAQLNDGLILGAGTSTLEARYLFIDPGVRDGRTYSYLIEDVERTGKWTLHGPVTATAGGPAAPDIDPAAYDRVATLGGELSPTVLAVLPGGAVGAAAGSGPALGGADLAPIVIPSTASAPEKILKILSQDSAGMVIEIRTDPPSLSSVTLDGIPYTDVRIQGFAQAAEPGMPALPALGLPLEIPDVADVTMAIEQVKAKTVGKGVLPAPAPLLTLEPDGGVSSDYTPDPTVYQGANAYPAAPVRLGGSVRQGESRLLVLVASPVTWSPGSGVLTHARRVRVRLDFHGAGAQASSASSDQRRENQFYLASQGALKIAVERTGLQAVTGAALINAGLDPSVDPRFVSLYNEGREVAVLFQGEEDGVLDAEDLLLFNGENRDDDHALARSYWLMHGNLAGRRMALRDAAPSGQPSGEALTDETVRLEKNLVYLPFVLNGETSNFVGDSIFLNPRDQMITLEGVSGGAATLRMRLQGATSDSNVNPDHHMAISVNGVPVGDALWDGFSAFEGSFPVPPGALQEGANQVRLTPVADTGAIFDFDYVDWVEINHPRSLGAAGETLDITTRAAGDRRIEGIVGQTAILLDVTDPDAPVRLTGAVFAPDAAGGTLEFRMGAGERRVLLSTDEGLVTPAGVTADLPSALHDAPGTDWLAITHADFMAGASDLAGLRALEGHRARVVDVQDVYDEFGHGDPDPRAIRDYLAWQYAQGGDPRLRYVLLVGDASYDERNYLGQPNRNFVPSKLLDGTFTERSSDNWFASFLGDDSLPDVALGRLPVKSAAELDSLVAKIAGYAAQPLSQEWQARALLVADDGFRDFHAGEAAIFEGASDAMVAQLPPNFDPLKLFLSDIPEVEQQTVARQVIIDTLNAGALTAVYTGHGAITLWADEVIFRASDLALLRNADRLPFVMVLNCLNGLFSAPLGDALGESMLLKENAGAAAFFAPTGVSPIGGQDIFGEAVMRTIFREGHTRIGDALVRARESILGLEFFDDLSESWVLLGDPAMRLAFLPVPIADAGEDIETLEKSLVRLQGTVRGGAPAPHAYAWRLISAPAGSRVRIDKAGERNAQFKADAAGAYVIELVVTSGGLESKPDTLRVLVLPRKSGKEVPDGF
ncbi:MAG: C25 family cysteine peptidase, partial [Deltaproteobacteria bacterium]|nr:C25 family cysteine peptidase [Deltaproteobacteria bacterium]